LRIGEKKKIKGVRFIFIAILNYDIDQTPSNK